MMMMIGFWFCLQSMHASTRYFLQAKMITFQLRFIETTDKNNCAFLLREELRFGID